MQKTTSEPQNANRSSLTSLVVQQAIVNALRCFRADPRGCGVAWRTRRPAQMQGGGFPYASLRQRANGGHFEGRSALVPRVLQEGNQSRDCRGMTPFSQPVDDSTQNIQILHSSQSIANSGSPWLAILASSRLIAQDNCSAPLPSRRDEQWFS